MEITKKFLEDKVAKLKGDFERLTAEASKCQSDAIATNGAVQMCEIMLAELAKEEPKPEATKLTKVE